METTKHAAKIIVKCPKCEWRILDKISPTSGIIEVKCPRCREIVRIDLSLRKITPHKISYEKA